MYCVISHGRMLASHLTESAADALCAKFRKIGTMAYVEKMD